MLGMGQGTTTRMTLSVLCFAVLGTVWFSVHVVRVMNQSCLQADKQITLKTQLGGGNEL